MYNRRSQMLKCSVCNDILKDERFPVIECSRCHVQRHLYCLRHTIALQNNVETYYCYGCEEKYNLKSTLKKDHLAFIEDLTEDPKRNGSKQYLEKFKKKNFLSAEDIPLLKMKGKDLTMEYLETNGFKNPILVQCPDNLELEAPDRDFSLDELVRLIGHLRELPVIEVSTQKEHVMHLEEWVEYFNDPDRKKILNVLSLEFSDTKFSDFVKPPKIVLDMSWVSKYWKASKKYEVPNVQKYCLMSTAGSYTDFHIDFSGSSVWYHILRGAKKFYLVPPTTKNLESHARWMTDLNQPYLCFRDYVDTCYELDIKEGETVFIPSGWIHSVITPVDSVVFGGNFLHSLSVESQLKIYDIEDKIDALPKYRFNNFKAVHWFAAQGIFNEVSVALRKRGGVKKYLFDVLATMYPRLKEWSKKNELEPAPPEVSWSTLLPNIRDIVRARVIEFESIDSGVKYYRLDDNFSLPVPRKKRRTDSSARGFFQF